jgi:hypothetical protein
MGNSNGTGNTFQLTWHNPADNLVFKQRRDAMTRFGQGVTIVVGAAKLPEGSFVNANVRVSFFMKLEGKFDRLEVRIGSRFYTESGLLAEGGMIDFKTLAPPPQGSWFQYESVHPKGEKQRGLAVPVEIRLFGRGNVSLRDVALSTTDKPPDKK